LLISAQQILFNFTSKSFILLPQKQILAIFTTTVIYYYAILHALHEMRHITTDVTRSVVCMPVCLWLCWSHGCAVQMWLNWSRCRSGGWLLWAQGTVC